MTLLCFLAALSWFREATGIRTAEDFNSASEDILLLLVAGGIVLVVVSVALLVLFGWLIPWLMDLAGLDRSRYRLSLPRFFTGTSGSSGRGRDTTSRHGPHRSGDQRQSHQLPTVVRPLLEYWRQSTIDTPRMSLNESEVQTFGIPASPVEICTGQVNPRVAEKLAQQEQAGTTRPRRGPNWQGSEEEAPRPVIIAPAVLTLSQRGGVGDFDLPRLVVPLWVPAILTPSNKLLPPRTGEPWIPRQHLEPVEDDSALILGQAATLELFLDRLPVSSSGDWAGYWQSCEALFMEVCGTALHEFSLQGYDRRSNGLILSEASVVGGSKNVLRLYNDILEGRCAAGLTTNFTRRPSRRLIPIQLRRPSTVRAAQLHCGQFESTFGLSPSQRRALHHTLLLGNGEILAVTGPPGTGKTTFIQSIVASLWVKSALQRDGLPPFLVSCSETNQATTNVIDSFGKAIVSKGPLAGRWLPGLDSYGLFCSSETKSRELPPGVLYTLADGTGSLNGFENQNYIRNAREHFLAQYSQLFPPTKNLHTAAQRLKRELTQEYQALQREIRTALATIPRTVEGSDRAGFFKKVAIALDLYPESSDRAVIAALHSFDTTRRHRAFQLATHYWEARWLAAAPSLVERFSERPNMRRLRLPKSDWQIRAMLTPCFVSTFTMSPIFFGGTTAADGPPIDLLVTDEASQVAPEIGAATFALAKRAVVVGDPNQLEPVWSIPSHTDLGNLTRYGLISSATDKRLELLKSAGILSSSGSLMEMALNCCPVGDSDQRGCFLSEHRRCVPQIVEFANRLSYSGRLESLRPELSNRLLPAFGYKKISGFCASQGQSRLNKQEAEAVADWINQMQQQIEQHYKKPIGEVLAVLTPFRAQANYLKRLISTEHPDITVGTVGALQGAEREIVLFSSVHDQTERRELMFDRSPNLLNVAVTRAKDSFLVFGDIEVFSKTDGVPSALLRSQLLASGEIEAPADIRSVNSRRTDGASAAQVETAANTLTEPTTHRPPELIKTLDGHRQELINALREARHEVIVVSAFVSDAAIKHDGLDTLIKEALSRGVNVKLYTDKSQDQDPIPGKVGPRAKSGVALLRSTGAKLHLVRKIHAKCVITDDATIVVGSFNFLSAARIANSKGSDFETSVKHFGADARPIIDELKLELDKMRID